MGKLMMMKKVMNELGDCKKIVQNAQMDCFFEMQAAMEEVRDERQGGWGQDEAKEVSEVAQQCYYDALVDLGKCLQEENGDYIDDDDIEGVQDDDLEEDDEGLDGLEEELEEDDDDLADLEEEEEEFDEDDLLDTLELLDEDEGQFP